MPISCRALSHSSYLLHVDEACVLLDCGSQERAARDFGKDEDEDAAFVAILKEIAPSLTLILLSHPLPSSIGWLPFLVNRCGLSPACAIYASPPTIALARIAWAELQSGISLELDSGFSTTTVRTGYTDQQLAQIHTHRPWKFTALELSAVVSRLSPIRFASPLLLVGRNAPLTLLANRAGHTLGGTIWTLRTPTNEEITYAPVWNHVRERLLDPASSLVSTATSAFAKSKRQKGITLISADRARLTAPKSSVKNKALIAAISETLRSAHSVLIPVDAAGRAIEIAVLLDQQWPFANLLPHPLCFVTRSKDELQLALKNLHEYFGNNAAQTASNGLTNEIQPDIMKNIRFFATPQDLDDAVPPTVARCVICAPATLSYGFSRALFLGNSFAQTTGNMVVLSSRMACEDGSLSDYLFKKWEQGQEGTHWGNDASKIGHVVDLNGDKITLTTRSKAPLEGEELGQYMVKQKQEAQSKAKIKAVQDRKRRLEEAAQVQSDDEELSSDDGSDDEQSESGAKRIKFDLDGDSAMQDITNNATTRRRGLIGDAEVGLAPIGTGFSTGISDEFADAGAAHATVDLYVRAQHVNRSEFTLPIVQDDGTVVFPPLKDHARLRIFPFQERRRKVDAYGEVVDTLAWQTRGRAEGETQVVEMSTINQIRRKRDEDAARERVEPPHKYTSQEIEVNLNCSVFAIDLEGRADGKALKTLLPHLNPRKLVLIGANEQDTADVKESCLASVNMTRSIYTPQLGESVDIGDDVQSFSVRLDDELLSSVALQKVEDYEIIRLSGVLTFTDTSSIPIMSQGAASGAISASAHVQLLASFQREDLTQNMELDSPSTLPPLDPSLYIGDIRLAALRQRLIAQNMPAAFAGEGILVCGPAPSKLPKKDPKTRLSRGAKASATPDPEQPDTSGGRVAVRKVKDGELLIEGAPGETYTIVREMVYALHAAAE